MGSTVSGAPTRQPMRRPARQKAFENVRPTMTFGNDERSGMNVTPANSAYASSTNTTASAVSNRKISNAGSGTIDSSTGPETDGRRYATDNAMMPSSRPFRSVMRSGGT